MQVSSQAAQLTAQEGRLGELSQRCAAQEEALCAGRTRLDGAVRAFSAMAVVCQALDHRAQEASSAKQKLQRQLKEVIEQTKEVAAQCESLIREKENLRTEMAKETENFRQKMTDLTTSHRTALQNERSRLEKEREAAIDRVIDQHSAEVKTLKQFHDKELERSRMHFEGLIQDIKASHTNDLQEISRRDEKHLEELQNQHERRISEITQRFEDMKVTLSNRIQVLHVECNELRSRSFEENEHARRHSDVKFQAAIQQFQHLPEENASLKAVLDLRINENADLRRHNTELQEKIRGMEELRVKNDQLARQNENLEAIISLKSNNEKQLQERHQSLLRRFDRENKEKKRLSMGYEELLYKLEECQSSEDLTKRSLSDIPSMTSSAVVMRTHTPSRPRPRGLQHDRSKRKTIASSRELD